MDMKNLAKINSYRCPQKCGWNLILTHVATITLSIYPKIKTGFVDSVTKIWELDLARSQTFSSLL